MVSGWWYEPIHLKDDGVKVSWDDEIPNIWKKNMFQTTNQVYSISHNSPMCSAVY